MCDQRGRCGAAGARVVLHDRRLTLRRRQPPGQSPGDDIDAPAGPEWIDDPYRAVRKGLVVDHGRRGHRRLSSTRPGETVIPPHRKTGAGHHGLRGVGNRQSATRDPFVASDAVAGPYVIMRNGNTPSSSRSRCWRRHRGFPAWTCPGSASPLWPAAGAAAPSTSRPPRTWSSSSRPPWPPTLPPRSAPISKGTAPMVHRAGYNRPDGPSDRWRGAWAARCGPKPARAAGRGTRASQPAARSAGGAGQLAARSAGGGAAGGGAAGGGAAGGGVSCRGR